MQKTYFNEVLGCSVMTAEYLLSRGKCCKLGCMHCPYKKNSMKTYYTNSAAVYAKLSRQKGEQAKSTGDEYRYRIRCSEQRVEELRSYGEILSEQDYIKFLALKDAKKLRRDWDAYIYKTYVFACKGEESVEALFKAAKLFKVEIVQRAENFLAYQARCTATDMRAIMARIQWGVEPDLLHDYLDKVARAFSLNTARAKDQEQAEERFMLLFIDGMTETSLWPMSIEKAMLFKYENPQYSIEMYHKDQLPGGYRFVKPTGNWEKGDDSPYNWGQ